MNVNRIDCDTRGCFHKESDRLSGFTHIVFGLSLSGETPTRNDCKTLRQIHNLIIWHMDIAAGQSNLSSYEFPQVLSVVWNAIIQAYRGGAGSPFPFSNKCCLFEGQSCTFHYKEEEIPAPETAVREGIKATRLFVLPPMEQTRGERWATGTNTGNTGTTKKLFFQERLKRGFQKNSHDWKCPFKIDLENKAKNFLKRKACVISEWVWRFSPSLFSAWRITP